MKTRWSVFLLLAVLAGCAPENADEAPAEASAADAATTADEAALEQIRADYVQHYNLHHASVVADLFADSAFGLWANGRVELDRAQILAGLEADMAASPALELTTIETMVVGDHAVATGAFDVTTTPEGAPAPLSLSGNYLTYFTRADGQWKIGGVITNFDAPPPEGAVPPPPAEQGEPPADQGAMAELVAAYTQAMGAGDWAAVANLYTEDAQVSFSEGPWLRGRAEIQARLAERFGASMPEIEIHDVGTVDVGDGWALDAGWYVLNVTTPEGPASQRGAYLSLARQQPDGSWKMHWAVTNGGAQPAM